MNDHNRTQHFLEEVFDGVSEMQSQSRKLYPIDKTQQLCVEKNNILLVNDVEYRHHSISIKFHNFQEWKLRLTEKNSLHFGISFFI